MIALYFVTDGVQKVFDTQKETWILKHKSQQIETSLYNSGLLMFEFTYIVRAVGGMLTFIVGAVEIVSASAFLFYDDASLKMKYGVFLLGCLAYDALLIHLPFTGDERTFGREMTHFTADVALAGAVFMAVGFRDQTKNE